MSDRFNNVGRHEHLEAEQERSTDADLVDVGVLLGYRQPQLAISRPCDTSHDDENAEDFDPAPNDANEVIDQWFEALDRIFHLRTSGCSRRATYHHHRLRQLCRSRAAPARYCRRGDRITGRLCPVLAICDNAALRSLSERSGHTRIVVSSPSVADDPERTSR